MMRIGLAIDAACDLSHAFLLQHNVSVMPIAVRVDGEVFMDDREPAEIQRFINRRLGSRSHSAETYPFSVKQIENFFLNRLVLEKDCMFCLTMMATRSPINEHVNRATFGILKNYRKVREAASVPGPFMMRVIDTQNLFAGTAPPVYEAARMIKANAPVATIRERLNFIANNTYTYSVPRDLYYIRARGKKKNEQSVSLFSAMLGSAMDIKPLLRAYRGETSPARCAASTTARKCCSATQHGACEPACWPRLYASATAGTSDFCQLYPVMQLCRRPARLLASSLWKPQ
jgi:fatty acid-binding protein DegV